jgi:hypothetical protein
MLLTGQYMGCYRSVRFNVALALADSTPVPKDTAIDHRELTLTDLLGDPMTLAVMVADEVDPAALEAALSGLARKLELARPAERKRVCFGEFFTPRQKTGAYDQMRQKGRQQ